VSLPSPRTAVPPPCLPLDIKDSLKEDMRLFGMQGGFWMGEAFWMQGGFWMGEAF
jgi:hypothetical protein